MSEYSKLDLFRREVDTQVATLQQILPVLKTAPADRELDQATQSVHSLWGTAQIVEIEAAVKLAQVMKACFAAAQNQTVTLGEEQIDVLLHASDLLFNISRVADGELEPWLTDHAWDLATTQKAIAIIVNAGQPPASAHESISDRSQANEAAIDQLAAVPQFPCATPIVDAISTIPVNISENIAKTIPEVAPATIPQNIVETSPAAMPTPSAMPAAIISANLMAALNTDGGSMMDLFRLEVEAQVTVLNEGLLALEDNAQSGQALETLMRAAHSIKGAARIVALDAVVNLAHVMEDSFVAAQGKAIVLQSDQVDVLLQGVDLLQGISQVSNAALPDWLTQQHTAFAQVQAQVAAILNPAAPPALAASPIAPVIAAVMTPAVASSVPPMMAGAHGAIAAPVAAIAPPVAPVVAVPTEPSAEPAKATVTDASAPQDRVVRVSAENLNRIMGLAGESLIEANWLQPYADSMMALKWRLVDLSRQLEQLQSTFDRPTYAQDTRDVLKQARQKEQDCIGFLSERLNELELYAQRTANLSDRLYREVISSHMRPFADGVQGFPRMIRDLARKLNKQVRLDIQGKATSVDRDILKKLEAPLTHILRNAADHGIELPADRIAAGKPAEGIIRLEAFHRGGMLAISIIDDGRGINPEWLRQKVISKKLATPEMVAQLKDAELLEFIFLPGFSTAQQVTEISGRGVGLDIAKSMAQEVGGNVRAVSQVGKGTSFHFQLPLTLSVVRTLLVAVAGNPYAIPLARIDHVLTIERSEISDIENRQYFTLNQQNIGLIPAHQVLHLPPTAPTSESLFVVVISEQSNVYGLVVDQFLGERDLVVRPLDPRLGKVPDISASSLLGDGTPVLIVDVSDMVRSIDRLLSHQMVAKLDLDAVGAKDHRKKILVVDDSITVREMERKMLENCGYHVDVAINGAEGWSAVRTQTYDLVISDVDMPKMNGIELVRQIKTHSRLKQLPVIIVSYRDREEDRIQGLDAGADYYLTKSSFQDDSFVGAVIDLIGR
jgi:two-component system, chemotaxis family, sensor histidine kinase and response regulator WspE